MEKSERHYLLQCNYCGGFAQGRFSFIMFIQMFMLIFWFKRAGLFSFHGVYVCVDVFCVDGCRQVEEKCFLMNAALEVVGCD